MAPRPVKISKSCTSRATSGRCLLNYDDRSHALIQLDGLDTGADTGSDRAD